MNFMREEQTYKLKPMDIQNNIVHIPYFRKEDFDDNTFVLVGNMAYGIFEEKNKKGESLYFIAVSEVECLYNNTIGDGFDEENDVNAFKKINPDRKFKGFFVLSNGSIAIDYGDVQMFNIENSTFSSLN